VRGDAPPAFKMLARVSRILEQLVQAWNVLATMTPSEYSAMRPYLGQSSGFQSYQYRQLEFLLGNKNVQMLQPHAHRPEILAEVRATLEAPSFYDEVVRLLARRGFPIAPERLERDWTQPMRHDETVEAAWLEVYRHPQQHWELYEMAEELVDLEDAFRQWRFRHVTTVERIIGFKQGTGGERRAVSAQDARRRAVPRALARAHHAVAHARLTRPARRGDERAASYARGKAGAGSRTTLDAFLRHRGAPVQPLRHAAAICAAAPV
jgi:tryptophan 2,3-dioxygenase